MEHLFLTKGWLYRCLLLLNNVRLSDYLNVQKTAMVIREADLETWPSRSDTPYSYRMSHTFLSPNQIILAHESGAPDNTSKAVVYEKRLSRKFSTHRYEFHLTNGIILVGNANLKNDMPNPTRPFTSVTDFRIGFHRPNDPRGSGRDKNLFIPFSSLDYVILNTNWIHHFHKLMPHEGLLWFPE